MPDRPSQTPTVLLTGFEPFGEGSSRQRNVSGEAVLALAQKGDAAVPGARVVGRVLPVAYQEAPQRLWRAIDETRPAIVIATGIHRREVFRLETTAHNRDNSEKPDNAGLLRVARAVDERGPAELRTGLPIGALHDALTRMEFPVEVSDDAGGFLCNHVFYRLRLWHQEDPMHTPAVSGFVHVPPLKDERSPFSIHDLIRGIQRIAAIALAAVPA